VIEGWCRGSQFGIVDEGNRVRSSRGRSLRLMFV
jgi:hypothetical protein